MGLCGQVLADLAGQRQNAKAAGDRDGLVPVSVDRPRGKRLTMLHRQLVINHIPLRL